MTGWIRAEQESNELFFLEGGVAIWGDFMEEVVFKQKKY